jgi:hypothetical protein
MRAPPFPIITDEPDETDQWWRQQDDDARRFEAEYGRPPDSIRELNEQRKFPMPLKVQHSKKKDFMPAPAGQHIAVCRGVVDVGPQETPWGTKPKVYICWQLPNVPVTWTDKDGQTREGFAEVGAFYTNSDNEKGRLRQMLEAWRGAAFTEAEIARGIDLFSLVGRACQVTVQHRTKPDGRVFASVTAVAPLLTGMTAPVLSGEPMIFSRADGRGVENLPDWLQKMLRSVAGSATKPQDAVFGGSADEPDDEIPF